MTRETNVKILWSPYTLPIFWSRLLRCPVIEFVLSEEYVMQWSQSNGNAFLTSLHTSYSCCAVKPLLMFGMSSEEVAISSESLSTCVSKTGKSLSSTSLFPSVAYPYQSESTIAPFRSLVICFATAPVTICVVFVWPHWYLFFILESGNMFLNSLAARYGVLKRKLCSVRKPKKRSSAFTTSWSRFGVAELGAKSVNFLSHYAASKYLWFEVS